MNTKKSWPSSSICRIASSVVIGLTSERLGLDDRPDLGSSSSGTARSAVLTAGDRCVCLSMTLPRYFLMRRSSLSDDQVDGGVHVGRRLARADDRPLREDRDLGDLVVLDRRVPLGEQLDLDLVVGSSMSLPTLPIFSSRSAWISGRPPCADP